MAGCRDEPVGMSTTFSSVQPLTVVEVVPTSGRKWPGTIEPDLFEITGNPIVPFMLVFSKGQFATLNSLS